MKRIKKDCECDNSFNSRIGEAIFLKAPILSFGFTREKCTPLQTKNGIGQTSLDFLAGISIFLLAFIFVIAFIPGMFAPFHSNSDELTMTADRVAATLVEDKLTLNSPGSDGPGIIDLERYENLKDSVNPDPLDPLGTVSKQTRSDLGLVTNTGGTYGLEVVLELQGVSTNPAKIDSEDPRGTTNIGQSRRIVYVRDYTAATESVDYYPGRLGILTVRVWQ